MQLVKTTEHRCFRNTCIHLDGEITSYTSRCADLGLIFSKYYNLVHYSEVLSLKMNMLPVHLVKSNRTSMLLKHLSSCEWRNNVL